MVMVNLECISSLNDKDSFLLTFFDVVEPNAGFLTHSSSECDVGSQIFDKMVSYDICSTTLLYKYSLIVVLLDQIAHR